MGNTASVQKQGQPIIHQPQLGEASEFYWACRNGDLTRVRELIATIPYEDVNRLEPNGSTALHVASYCGHVDIVRLLLHQVGCRRELRNRFGLTAYEEALSDEVRSLFHRPDGRNRFCAENNDEYQDFGNIFGVIPKEDVDKNDCERFIEDKWLKGYEASKDVETHERYGGILIKVWQTKWLMSTLSYLYKKLPVDEPFIENLDVFIRKHIPKEHHEFEKANVLALDYQKECKPEHLLRLYTLETPLYGALADDVLPLAQPLFTSLEELKPRYFRGKSYRGMKITEDNLRAYRWALKKKGVIESLKFCSTSLHRYVAEGFAAKNELNDGLFSALLIFNFPETCDTAINLGKISCELPCVSEYENEAEVLLLPSTMFMITGIDTTDQYIIIHLENVPEKRSSWLSILFWN